MEQPPGGVGRTDRLLNVLLFEYGVQTRDRRLYAQSMMVAMGFVVAAFAVLIGAWVQSGRPVVLVVVAPLMFLGGEIVLLLRVALIRVSVYLTIIEEEIRKAMRLTRRPIAWESSMTGRIAAVAQTSTPARGAPGLSIQLILAFGVGIGFLAMLAGYAVLRSGQAESLLSWLPGGQQWYEMLYVVINLVILAAIVATWTWQVPALTTAHTHFTRVRSGAPLDEVIARPPLRALASDAFHRLWWFGAFTVVTLILFAYFTFGTPR